MHITQVEYLERLSNLLPPDAFQLNRHLSIGQSSIQEASMMVEAISEEILKMLDQFKETDQILDLKDAVLNTAVLGRFLACSYRAVFEEPQ